MRNTIRLMIVDDHPVVRDGLAAILREAGNVDVVASVASGEEALPLAVSLQPDVVLMDIHLKPGCWNGLQTTAQLRAQSPQVQVLLMTGNDHRQYHVEAAKQGAQGCISKDWQTDHILMAVALVSQGLEVFPSSLQPIVPLQPLDDPKRLTLMEKNVFMLLLRGSSPDSRYPKSDATKIIADELGISERTCSEHRANIKKKLGELIPLDMVRYALKQGWLSLEDITG